MKKLILGMFAVAGLFATSCSSEDDLFVVSPDAAAQVTFDIDVEGVLATRAIGDASGINKLVYAVYDANGEDLAILNIQGSDGNNQFVKTPAFNNLTESVAVTLAKGQKYTVLFWAQNSTCNAYTTTDLEAVAVDYATVNANNDETRDAFYAAATFEVKGDQKVNVTMKRPFAQVNLGVTSEDWAAAEASGVEIETSKVVIKQAATTIDLKSGAVGDPVDVTYDFAAIPTESLMVDTDGDGTNESYKYLSMSYILVNDDASTDGADKATVEVEYTFSPKNGGDITFSDGLATVPVQRNYRTNIVGTILTGVATLDITIDPIFAGENFVDADLVQIADGVYQKKNDDSKYFITKAAGLEWISNNVATAEYNGFEGKTITLTADIDLYKSDSNGDPICFDPIGSYRNDEAFKGTFDGQNHTISNMSQNTWALDNGYYFSDLGMGLFALVEDATIKNLIMDNANISGENGLCGIVAATAYGDCTFENITVKNSKCNDYQYYAGGIVGWASGNHTFINCNVEASTTIGGQWGDFSNCNGGIIGGIGGSATISLKDCNVACRIDAVNDVVSAYQWYAYISSGMLIGNTNKTQTIDGTTYAAAPQLTCENVTVTYGDWMNYTYCEFAGTGYPYVRVQAGVSVDAYSNVRYGHPTDANGNTVVDDNHVHNAGEDHHLSLPFDQLFGCSQRGVYGLATFDGVTVNYPASYNP